MHRSGVCACAGSLCPKMTPYPGRLYKEPEEWSPIANPVSHIVGPFLLLSRLDALV